MSILKISLNTSKLSDAQITLSGSKSISNRVLIIQALSKTEEPIYNLSNSNDTQIMKRLLKNSNDLLFDAGDAGTAFRFMAAFLALKPGKHFLTGSQRMLKRPIAVLVDALNKLGANITYSGKKGFPPLSISTGQFENAIAEISVDASVSSQYISALLMIAPYLPFGLKIKTENAIVSEPYIDMTISLMGNFGVFVSKYENCLQVDPSKYQLKPYTIESDWSSASYFYSIALLSKQNINISLKTLYRESIQGDSQIAEIMKKFGISTEYKENGLIEISNRNKKIPAYFEYDFTNCPDLAQTLALVCAAMNVPAVLKGLQTLRIKETDRIEALKTELGKMGAELNADFSELNIKKGIDCNVVPDVINTYNDHRMAMSFAPLTLIYDSLKFDDAEVVSKSYPEFWEDLKKLGFTVK